MRRRRLSVRHWIATGVAMVAIGLAWPHVTRYVRSRDLPTDEAIQRQLLVSSQGMARPRDFFRTIDNPRFHSAADARGAMSDDEVVLGIASADGGRAYPINYLNDHEMVRDELDGQPILVTW